MNTETHNTADKQGTGETTSAGQAAPEEEPTDGNLGATNSGKGSGKSEAPPTVLDRTKSDVSTAEEPVEIPASTQPSEDDKSPGERLTDWSEQILYEQDEELRVAASAKEPDMKPKGLPKLNLGEGAQFTDSLPTEATGEERNTSERRDSKTFNIRITDGCKERALLLRKDLRMESITWNDLLEMLIILLCQNGCVGEETIKKIEKAGGWKGGIPRELKMEFGTGTRWPEVGPAVIELSENVQHAWRVILQTEDILSEFLMCNLVCWARNSYTKRSGPGNFGGWPDPSVFFQRAASRNTNSKA